jgi:glycolate oxidase FAD binding subunit
MSESLTFSPEAFAVDGKVPREVWRVETEEQLSEALRTAYSDSLAVIPLGSGTKRHIGLPPVRYDVALSLRSLHGIVEYSPDDLVVIVRAGTTLAELQKVLSERNQFLPIDPPLPEQATIGGIVASAMAGPIRCLYGAVREHLLGVKVAQPDGTITRFGGKVVKNVAGYDVTKLYVGSFGTLGVIVEAAFKVRPLPEKQATLPLWGDKLKAVETFLSRLVLTDISPAFAELLNAAVMEQIGLTGLLAQEEPYCLLLGFDGFKEELDWWLAESQRLATETGLKAGPAIWDEAKMELRAKVRDAHAGENDVLVLKALVPSSEICAFAQLAQEVLGEQAGIIAHSLNGIVRTMVSQMSDKEPTDLVQTLLNWAVQKGGNLVVEKAPVEWKAKLPVWGHQTEAWQLMRRLKKTLDPLNILSPGRMFASEVNANG